MVVHLLTPALAEFRRAYPDITVSVQDAGSARIERVVLEGEVDFGLATPLRRYPQLDYAPILSDPFGVVMPHDHPLAAAGAPLRWADLAGHDYVGLSNDTGIGAFLEAYPQLAPAGKPGPHDHASSTTSLYAMLKMGGKISVLPALAAQANPMSEFKFVALSEPVVEREICLITRQLRSLSANTKRILDALMAVATRR